MATLSRRLARLMIKTSGGSLLVRTSEIDRIETADNYVRVHIGGVTHLIRHTLDSLEACLDSDQFARIHRCTLVNLDRVVEIRPDAVRGHVVVLAGGTQLKMSERGRESLECRFRPRRIAAADDTGGRRVRPAASRRNDSVA